MQKNKIKKLADYIPLVILAVSAFALIRAVMVNDLIIRGKHIAGLCIVPLCFLVFLYNHRIGVLVLALSLLTGLAGLISYSPYLSVTTIMFGKSETSAVPVFKGQPIFLLWLLIHFIVSGRHYVGILTREYWKKLGNKPGAG